MSTVFGVCPQLQLFTFRLFYSTSISGSPVHHLGPMAEVPSSYPSPFPLYVSIASLCRLSSEYVHRCKISLFANQYYAYCRVRVYYPYTMSRGPNLVFVGEETQRRTLRSTTQSMSTVFGVCPWTEIASFITHYVVTTWSVFIWMCREHVHKRDVSLLSGGMQGRILDGNDMLRQLGFDL